MALWAWIAIGSNGRLRKMYPYYTDDIARTMVDRFKDRYTQEGVWIDLIGIDDTAKRWVYLDGEWKEWDVEDDSFV